MEAISVIFPFSMYSSSDCCCFLLKYCISSRYKSTPFGVKSVSSSAIMPLMSDVPAVVALSLWSALPDFSAIYWQPSSSRPRRPVKIIFGILLLSMMRRKSPFGPSICSCPTTSSSVVGRISSASGRYIPSPPLSINLPENLENSNTGILPVSGDIYMNTKCGK